MALICQQWGFQTATVTNALFLVNANCVLTPILAWLMFGERPGSITALAAVLMLVGAPSMSGLLWTWQPMNAGDTWCLVSAPFYAIWMILLARHVRRHGNLRVLSSVTTSSHVLQVLIRVRIHGPFRVKDDDGTDATPVGMKERALLALVLLSPGQRRSRGWLQDRLWSDRDAQQGSGSLRQALSNICKALGPAGDLLQADRTAIWLDPEVGLPTEETGKHMDDIDVRDPEFSNWLRDQRQATVQAAPDRESSIGQANRRIRATVLLHHQEHDLSSRMTFLTRSLSQRIAGDLLLIGGMDILQPGPDGVAAGHEPANVLVEVETFGEGDAGFVMVRVSGLPARRAVWSGRVSISASISDLRDAPEATRLVNQTVRKVADLVAAAPHMAHQQTFHRAVRRVYEYHRGALAKAGEMFTSIQEGELRGPALAWRTFVRLTYALEFRDSTAETAAEASAVADEPDPASVCGPVELEYRRANDVKKRSPWQRGLRLDHRSDW